MAIAEIKEILAGINGEAAREVAVKLIGLTGEHHRESAYFVEKEMAQILHEADCNAAISPSDYHQIHWLAATELACISNSKRICAEVLELAVANGYQPTSIKTMMQHVSAELQQ